MEGEQPRRQFPNCGFYPEPGESHWGERGQEQPAQSPDQEETEGAGAVGGAAVRRVCRSPGATALAQAGVAAAEAGTAVEFRGDLTDRAGRM